MNRLTAFFFVCLSVAVFGYDVPAINKKIIDTINSNVQSSWVAGANEFLVGKTTDDVKSLLGWNGQSKKLKEYAPEIVDAIPQSFDSATQWPNCVTIGTIYNQADCGSCWAFGCVEAASDRFCINSDAKFNEILSFMDETACAPCDGCEGGDPDSAWDFIAESGIVTATCSPYTIPTCPPAQQPCLNFVPTPNCPTQCNDTENWDQSLHYLAEAYDVPSNATAIQAEIMTNGPVEACFSVYEDFVNYKSGVYQYQNGSFLGGHCIKVIGWGVENGLPYWLCNNSWTTYWGWMGQFKILRGQDECGIEDSVVAGTPKI